MGTKLEELRSGCFAKAMDDEPMFVLLARDERAPELIREWCAGREAEVRAGGRPASDMAQIEEARQCAKNMEAWREAADGKWRTGLFARQEQLVGLVADGMAAEQRTHGADFAVDDDLGVSPEAAEADELQQREMDDGHWDRPDE